MGTQFPAAKVLHLMVDEATAGETEPTQQEIRFREALGSYMDTLSESRRQRLEELLELYQELILGKLESVYRHSFQMYSEICHTIRFR